MRKAIISRIVSKLLWMANTQPPSWAVEFYALKDVLLRRYGTLIGEDIQEITKECWGPCWSLPCKKDPTCKCRGTGIFDRYWVYLERWEMAGRVFHRPLERRWVPKRFAERVTIHGKVQHPYLGSAATETRLWLYLFFAPKLWIREMYCPWGVYNVGIPWRYPMVAFRDLTHRVQIESRWAWQSWTRFWLGEDEDDIPF